MDTVIRKLNTVYDLVMPSSKKIDIPLSMIQSPVAKKRHFKKIISTVYIIVNWNHVFTYYKNVGKKQQKRKHIY